MLDAATLVQNWGKMSHLFQQELIEIFVYTTIV